MKNYSIFIVLSFVMISILTLYSCSSNEGNNLISEEDFQELKEEENSESTTNLLKGPNCTPNIELHCGYFYVNYPSRTCCPNEQLTYTLMKQDNSEFKQVQSDKCKVLIDHSTFVFNCNPLHLIISGPNGILYTLIINPIGVPTSSPPYCTYC